jgi:hypothetical protein
MQSPSVWEDWIAGLRRVVNHDEVESFRDRRVKAFPAPWTTSAFNRAGERVTRILFAGLRSKLV